MKHPFKNTWLGTSEGGASGDLAQQVETNKNKIESLSNITIKNNLAGQTIPNLSFTNQKATTVINGATLAEVTAQETKNLYLDFVQPTSGFRNWNNFKIRAKVGEAEFADIFTVQSRAENKGLYFGVDYNKLYFLNDTAIYNMKDPDHPSQATSKKYVDSSVGTRQRKLEFVKINQTIPVGTGFLIKALTDNTRIIGLNIFQKRTNDSKYINITHAPINAHITIGNNRLELWPAPTTGYTQDFKIEASFHEEN